MGVEWFAIILPVLLSIGALIFYKHKLIFLEVAAPTVISIAVIAIMKWAMVKSLTDDTRYNSEYVTEARHYDRWNEYIHRTCYRTYKCGKSTCTQAYDCSYVQNHPEHWEIHTNRGNEYSITESYYKKLVKRFANEKYVDMHRNYHSIDGDMHKTVWDGDFATLTPKSNSQTYTNKTQAAHTLFKFRDLELEETEGLFDYPPVVDHEQDACLGCSKPDNLLLRKYNAYIGEKLDVKIFVLIFENQGIEIAEMQRQYWKNGNDNELVICSDKDGKWTRTFSWCDDKTVEVECNAIFNREDITIHDKLNLIEHEVEAVWHKKDFEDFNYIKVPLTTTQLVWLYIIVGVVSLALLIWGTTNYVDPD